MDKFIPVSKMTKKQQKEYYSKHRNTWNGLNPVTRTVPNGKGYNRNKQKQAEFKNGRLSQYDRDDCLFLTYKHRNENLDFFALYLDFLPRYLDSSWTAK